MAIGKKKTVYEVIADAMKERDAALSDLRVKLSAAEKAKKNADKKARETTNREVFDEAKEASRKAACDIEFYSTQIKNIESSPLFNNYTEKIAEVKADQQQMIDQINERATKAMHEINNMISAFYRDLERSNIALELVYKNTGFTYRPTITLPIGTIFKHTEATKVNPELSKYW